MAKRINGGLSHVGGALVNRISSQVTVGFPLVLDDIGPTLIYISYDGTIADGAANQYFFNWKGAAGTISCISCLNVTAMGGEDDERLDVHDVSHQIVDISENNESRFVSVSFEDRFMQADILTNLQGHNLTNEAMSEVERAYGITYNANGIFWMQAVRPTLVGSAIRYDPMHCFYQHGVAETELCFLLSALLASPQAITMRDMALVANAGWKTNALKHGLIHNLFTEARAKQFAKSQTFQCSASEMLTLIPLVTFFLETIPALQESIPLELASWKALDQLHRHLARAKLGIGAPQELADAIRNHGERYHAAYGTLESAFAPKYHWTRHLPRQLEQDKFLVDCWPAERGNKLFLAAADACDNTHGKSLACWETTVLARVVGGHRDELQSIQPDGPVNGEECPEFCEGARISLRGITHGTRVQAGDIAFVAAGIPFEFEAFISAPSGLFYVGKICDLLRRKTSGSAYYQPRLELSIVKQPKHIRLAACWCNEVEGTLIFDA